MSDERFNELLNGPLSHPLIMFRISRLAMALRYVSEAFGLMGEEALIAYCEGLEERDKDTASN